MGVVSGACLAFLEVGGWQESEFRSAAADTGILLLWAALPLVSKRLCLETQLPSPHPSSERVQPLSPSQL